MTVESLDILIVIALIVGMARGVTTGAVRQVVSFLGTVAAIMLALELMNTAGRLIRQAVPMSESLDPVVGFITVFLIIQFALIFAVRVIEAGIKAFRLSTMNRLAGAAVGACKAALMLSVFFLVSGFFDIPEEENQNASILYGPVATVFPATWDYAARHLPMFRDLTDRFGREVDDVLSNRHP